VNHDRRQAVTWMGLVVGLTQLFLQLPHLDPSEITPETCNDTLSKQLCEKLICSEVEY